MFKLGMGRSILMFKILNSYISAAALIAEEGGVGNVVRITFPEFLDLRSTFIIYILILKNIT